MSKDEAAAVIFWLVTALHGGAFLSALYLECRGRRPWPTS